LVHEVVEAEEEHGERVLLQENHMPVAAPDCVLSKEIHHRLPSLLEYMVSEDVQEQQLRDYGEFHHYRHFQHCCYRYMYEKRRQNPWIQVY
jgi:hypothetical protein